MTDNDKRAEIIAGLRALVDFFEQHPEMPLSHIGSSFGCVGGNGDEGLNNLFDLAESIDAQVVRKANGNHEARIEFGGGAAYELFLMGDTQPPSTSVVVTRPKRLTPVVELGVGVRVEVLYPPRTRPEFTNASLYKGSGGVVTGPDGGASAPSWFVRLDRPKLPEWDGSEVSILASELRVVAADAPAVAKASGSAA